MEKGEETVEETMLGGSRGDKGRGIERKKRKKVKIVKETESSQE